MYPHVSAPKNKHQSSPTLILVHIAKILTFRLWVTPGRKSFASTTLRSKSPFLSLHPARTDSKFWCNFSFPTLSYHMLFPNRVRGVRGSDMERPGGRPGHPAHLGRVTCQHNTGYSSTDLHPCQQLPQSPKNLWMHRRKVAPAGCCCWPESASSGNTETEAREAHVKQEVV